MATTRNGFFRDMIRKAMEKLTSYDNSLKVVEYIDESKVPSLYVFVADETRNQRDDFGGNEVLMANDNTCDFSIILFFTTNTGGDTPHVLNESGDEWIERIEYELLNIETDTSYTHEMFGSDYYLVQVNTIEIQKNERGFSVQNQKVQVLSISGKINYSITYL